MPAIRELIADGINVNITLLFAQQVYEQVVEAYLSGLEALAAKGGDVSQHRQRGEFLRQPHRHRGRQAARRENRRTPTIRTRKSAPQGAQGQSRDRQRQARLSALQAAVQRRALGGAGGQRREGAAAAVGLDRHQEQGLQRRALCRGTDRPRYRQHHAERDHGRVPRPRQGARHARRRCRRRAARARRSRPRRHFARRRDRQAGRGRRAAVCRRRRQAARRGRRETRPKRSAAGSTSKSSRSAMR